MITAKIIADSISEAGKRITTMELEYPRFIHSEFMTHRVFSRNAASSRAIPVAQVIERVRNDPAMPIHWGKNQPGMQANEEHDALVYPLRITGKEAGSMIGLTAKQAWEEAAFRAADIAEAMMEAGYHKQVVNRILEPFQHIKVVVTATEWDNFFKLRAHKDAQPEIHELALRMREAMDASKPRLLGENDWHLPYVDFDDEATPTMTLNQALMVSSSCCAQVSYRKLDQTLEKAEVIYKRLVEGEPLHASPFEHQATPAVPGQDDSMTGNLVGWIQYRKLIDVQ